MSQILLVLTPLDGLIALLESDEFYCDVAISSSSQAFYRRLAANPVTRELEQLLRANPGSARSVLSYAEGLARSISGTVRSERDAALCACIVALGQIADPRIDDFLRYLRTSKQLALRWASEIAEIVSRTRIDTVQTETTWSSLSSGTIACGQAGETRRPQETPSDFGVSRRDAL